MTVLKGILMLAIGGYVAVLSLLYLTQRRFLFVPPQAGHPTPAAAGWPEAEEVVLDTVDHEHVVIWQAPPREGRPVVIFFHGNGESIAARADQHRALTADGTGVVALSYRGYMGSTGQPSEAGLFADAEATLSFATSRYPASPVVLWGYSLGSGVAVALAARHKVAKVILEAPFSSILDVAALRFPFAPVRWLVRDPFRSDQRIDAVRAPLLFMHGDQDLVVPIGLGERLFKLAHEPKRFMRFSGGSHADLLRLGALAAARRFIDEAGD